MMSNSLIAECEYYSQIWHTEHGAKQMIYMIFNNLVVQ